MSLTAIKFSAAILLCGIAFLAGWLVRDMAADKAMALRDTADARAQVTIVEAARKDDRVTQQGTTTVESERVQEQGKAEIQFKYITREVIRYVAANPSPDGCGLDSGGLRIWRASSAGAVGAEPVDPAGPAGPLPR